MNQHHYLYFGTPDYVIVYISNKKGATSHHVGF